MRETTIVVRGRGQTATADWLCFVAFVFWVVPSLWYGSWTNALWYGLQYGVAPASVHTSDKPSDCDWSRSPLGNKGCYYKAVVSAFNAAGDLVRGDGAPKYGKDNKTGKPIISYDDGKTWAWSYADATPDLGVKTVRVEWIKVNE
jgi:hypothetical protein